VVARASNQTFQQFTQSRIGTPIGMSGRWINYTYYSRARDMARFGLLILARGTWNQTPVLRDTAYFRQMTTTSQQLNRAYGYLWWLNGKASYMLPGPQQTVVPGSFLPGAPPDMIAALGKNDQKIYVVPSMGLVVVRLGESAGVQRQAVSSFDAELWTRLMAMLNCRPTAATAAATLQVAAYPNPATTELKVELPTASPASTLRLLDALGRPVATVPARPLVRLPLSHVAAGVYYLQLLGGNSEVLATQRIVRQP
jgi:CubicO group peptidase (beta-lactamase class C family)